MQTQLETIKGLIKSVGAQDFRTPHLNASVAHLRAAGDALVNHCQTLQTLAKEAEEALPKVGTDLETKMAGLEKLKAAAAAVADIADPKPAQANTNS